MFLSLLLAAQIAAPAPDDDSAQREILVTARREAEPLDDAPISIAVATRRELAADRIEDIDDLIRTIPNATRAPRGPVGNAAISIRGIFSPVGAASVGIYVDDVPVQIRPIDFAGDPDLRLTDLDRVEVLRGPQGTLFGASSLGGTVRLVTAQPRGDRSYLSGDAELRGIDGGGIGWRLGAVASGPIAGEDLAYRLSAHVDRDPGYVDHVDPASGDVTARNINRADHLTARGAVRARIGGFTITPSLLVERGSRRDLPTFQSDLGPFRQAFPTRQPGWDHLLLGTLAITGDLGGATLTGVTSVLDRSAVQTSDYSPVFGELVLGGAIPGLAPPGGSASRVAITQRHVTQELRLNSTEGGRLHWVAGAFYQRTRFALVQRVAEPGVADLTAQYLGASITDVFGVPALPGSVTYLGHERVVETQKALYGEASLAIGRWEPFAGVRVSRSEVELDVSSVGPYAGTDTAIETHGRQAETPVTPRAGLRYRVNRALMVYASAGRGFRAGGANTPVPTGPCSADLAAFGRGEAPSEYGSDTVWSYEVGAKLATRALDLRGALFRLDWSNTLQEITLPNCGFSYNANLGDVRSQGFELEGALRPMAGLTLGFAGGYTDAHFLHTIVSTPTDGSDGALIVSAGDRVPYVPHGSLRVTGEYRWRIGRLNAFCRSEMVAQSNFVRGPSAPALSHIAETHRGPGYATLRASVGLSAEHWRATLFADNLTDARPILYNSADLVPATRSPLRQASLTPRTIGIGLATQF